MDLHSSHFIKDCNILEWFLIKIVIFPPKDGGKGGGGMVTNSKKVFESKHYLSVEFIPYSNVNCRYVQCSQFGKLICISCF